MVKARKEHLAALAAVAFAALATDAAAAPSFSRRYDVECSFCHEGYPKLNRLGQRFKERGFRLENEEAFDRSAWIRSVPISVRLQGAAYVPDEGETAEFAFLKGIAAGSLGSRFSFWVDDALFANSDDTRHVKPADAWGRFELFSSGETYLKAGRFELDLPFTQARTPHLLPYAPFGARAGLERSSPIEGYREGVEVGGGARGFRGSFALVKSRSDDSFGGAYVRVSRRLGSGSNRAGAFAFVGPSSEGEPRRFGADGSVWLGRIHLHGTFVHGSGRDFSSLESSLDAAFVGVDWRVRSFATLTGRFERVETQFGRNESSRQTFLAGVQLYALRSGRLSLQYDTKAKLTAVQVEAAF